MAEVIDLGPILLERISTFRDALNHPRALMKTIGMLVVKECRKAFTAQRLGDIEWPARYEGMNPPFINIAGALSDWNAGRKTPKPNRFQNRPALVDERNLWQSIMSRPGSDTSIFIGTNRPYAKLHQEGGWTEIPVTTGAKKAIFEWLYQKSKKFGVVQSKKKVTHHGMSGKEAVEKTLRSAYATHIEPLLYMDQWRQRVARRPFIGVTDQAEQEVRLAVQTFFKKAVR